MYCKLGIRHTISSTPVTEATTLHIQLWRCTLHNSSLKAIFEVWSMVLAHFTEEETKYRKAEWLAPESPKVNAS